MARPGTLARGLVLLVLAVLLLLCLYWFVQRQDPGPIGWNGYRTVMPGIGGDR